MFIGHYAASFALKAVDRSVPLWRLVLAVQLLDVFWGLFILLGIEKIRLVPGITASNPLDLYYMPYTHSLVAVGGWTLLTVWASVRFLRRGPGALRAGLVLGAAVLSHWVLDLVVHRPDLPLYDNAAKVGLGLWNHRLAAFLTEAGLLTAGILLWRRVAGPAAPAGRLAVFWLLLVGSQVSLTWVYYPPTPVLVAVTAVGSYLAITGLARWCEPTAVPA